MSAIASNAQSITEVQLPLTYNSKPLLKSIVANDEQLFYNLKGGVCDIYDYDFNLVRSFNFTSTSEYDYRCYKNFDTFEEANIAISQTLFNDDEKFEYVTNIENDNYGDIIFSEDGTILYSFPEGEFIEYIITIKGKNYIATSIYENESFCYLIDKQTTSIQKVAESKGSLIKTAKGSVKVQLQSATSGESEVTITAMSGQLAKKVQIPAEIKSLEISTEDMHSGIYNFTVTKKGKVLENGKIAIK